MGIHKCGVRDTVRTAQHYSAHNAEERALGGIVVPIFTCMLHVCGTHDSRLDDVDPSTLAELLLDLDGSCKDLFVQGSSLHRCKTLNHYLSRLLDVQSGDLILLMIIKRPM